MLLAAPVSRVGAVTLYGPGPHWVDRVRSGSAAFGAHAVVGVDLTFDGIVDATVEMTGSTEVTRSAARAGDPVHAARHRNHIDLEIVAMHLDGTLPGFGPITLDAGDGVGNQAPDGPLYSQGGSDEVPGDPRRSADFFDLHMELRLAGVRLHNVVPLRVVAVIDRLPPIGTPFTLDGGPVPFVTDAGAPVMQVVTATDVPTPPRAGPCELEGTDAAGIVAARAEVAARCACSSPRFRRCATRIVATRARSGQLNPGCRATLRRAVPSHCAGPHPAASSSAR